jgi:hypothetical protein
MAKKKKIGSMHLPIIYYYLNRESLEATDSRLMLLGFILNNN